MATEMDDCNFIKMEVDIDEEDFAGWALEDDEECTNNEDKYQLISSGVEDNVKDDTDPLLKLKPIIYTTKLDDMYAINMDIKERQFDEITKNIHSESKPNISQYNPKPISKAGDLDSFIKLASVIQQLNFKARLKCHSVKVRNSNLLRQCKPLNIILKDIRKYPPESNETLVPDELPINPYIITSNGRVSKVNVKIEPTDISYSKACELPLENSNVAEVHIKIESTDISDSEVCEVPLENVVINKKTRKSEKHKKNKNKPKAIVSPRLREESGSSVQKTKTRETPGTASPDEDDTALINYKTKPVNQLATHEKFTLIVLLHDNEAHIYRVNPTKLVTDYFISHEYDEYQVAAMYPKEEKIIETYCCWFKREENVTKLCSRKNYSFTIQKFLRLPHTCHPGDCQCCCSLNKASKSTNPQPQKLKVFNKSLASADDWVRGLINSKQNSSISLINKAMSYIPKTQIKERTVVKEAETCLEFTLLCIKCTNHNTSQDSDKDLEMYEIGNNGNVVRSYRINSNSKHEIIIRRACTSLGLKTIDISYCCWYTREKNMHDLRKANVAPTALKLIQTAHICEKNKCMCCCKPHRMPSKGTEILPPTFQHTTCYETNAHLLTIDFNLKSKLPHRRVKSYPVSTKTLNTTPILSDSDVTNNEERTTFLSKGDSSYDKIHDIANRISEFKNVKLDVTDNGKLEAVLNGPARNLSIAELSVLSDILACSKRQITELDISPEELCNKINSKTSQSNKIVASETPDISPPKPSSSSLQFENQNLLKGPSANLAQKKAVSASTSPSPITCASSKTKSKLYLTMYSTITNLMETKNKNYVNSFKSFFQSEPNTTNNSIRNSSNKIFLPKISDAFTLAQSSTCAAQGSKSDKTSGSRFASTVELNTSNITPKRVSSENVNSDLLHLSPREIRKAPTAKRKGASIDNSRADKKLRVKGPSELMESPTIQAPLSTVASNPEDNLIQNWPGPIVIKREPHTNIPNIVRPSQPFTVKVNPSLQTQAFIIGNNVVTAPSVQIVNSPNNVYHMNGNGLTRAIPDQTMGGNNMRYFTLTPMSMPPSNTNATDQSMLAQLLKTPQVQPSMPVGENPLPPLVPIRPTHVPLKSGPQHVQSISYVPISVNTVPIEMVKKEFPD